MARGECAKLGSVGGESIFGAKRCLQVTFRCHGGLPGWGQPEKQVAITLAERIFSWLPLGDEAWVCLLSPLHHRASPLAAWPLGPLASWPRQVVLLAALEARLKNQNKLSF